MICTISNSKLMNEVIGLYNEVLYDTNRSKEVMVKVRILSDTYGIKTHEKESKEYEEYERSAVKSKKDIKDLYAEYVERYQWFVDASKREGAVMDMKIVLGAFVSAVEFYDPCLAEELKEYFNSENM